MTRRFLCRRAWRRGMAGSAAALVAGFRLHAARMGVRLIGAIANNVGSPRHADILLCTGPVTRQSRDRLVRIYEQMPDPKFVLALGSCGLSGGVFHGSYNIAGGVDEVLPVSAYIPGCPPRPEAIIQGVVALLNSLKEPKG